MAVPAQFREVLAVPAALQVTALVPLQVIAPAVHTWVVTQAPLAPQACPAGQLTVLLQAPVVGLQLSVVQARLSLQLTSGGFEQAPF